MMYYRVSGRGGSRARPSGAILMGDAPHGFFMNWYGNQKGRRGGTRLLQPGTTRACPCFWNRRGRLCGRFSPVLPAQQSPGTAAPMASVRLAAPILPKSTVRCGFDRPLADAEVAGDLTVRSR
jgi:hypothetical protein